MFCGLLLLYFCCKMNWAAAFWGCLMQLCLIQLVFHR